MSWQDVCFVAEENHVETTNWMDDQCIWAGPGYCKTTNKKASG
jgi:hypothetical protein